MRELTANERMAVDIVLMLIETGRIQPMAEWQKIDTAPKDGTRIDLWANGERFANCRWDDIWDDPSMAGWHQFYAEADSTFPIHARPTHWMPLPDDPIGE